MKHYNFTEKELYALINKIKQQDFTVGRYLEDNISISEKGFVLKEGFELPDTLLRRVIITD